MVRQRMLAALAVGVMAATLPGSAKAAAYQLTDQVVVLPNPGSPGLGGFRMDFVVSDAAVSRGTFQLSARSGLSAPPGSPSIAPAYSGDVDDFIRLNVDGDLATPSSFMGTINSFAVTFAPDRTVSSFDLSFSSVSTEALLSGSGGTLISGAFGSDRPDCNTTAGTGRCRVSGRLVEVAQTIPEPMALALLGIGMIGLAAVQLTYPSIRALSRHPRGDTKPSPQPAYAAARPPQPSSTSRIPVLDLPRVAII